MEIWEKALKNPMFNKLFNDAMACNSKNVMQAIMAAYRDRFGPIGSLVDVGGGIGWVIATIVKANPHIQGINFDLLHVVATAPAHPGVEHVGGSMFESVPTADAVILKEGCRLRSRPHVAEGGKATPAAYKGRAWIHKIDRTRCSSAGAYLLPTNHWTRLETRHTGSSRWLVKESCRTTQTYWLLGITSVNALKMPSEGRDTLYGFDILVEVAGDEVGVEPFSLGHHGEPPAPVGSTALPQ
ncbi:hypothetical protein CRG98_043501 [Punica granatum]|uniref:O-methyltransferase C-terminal domain-containing protein n=1 Tax=Punica granatum TaxID=22663 RepID=A0A2I0HWL7_PUNGR|nr:hypothetical protein CRG98_043501 [Punica granatum]